MGVWISKRLEGEGKKIGDGRNNPISVLGTFSYCTRGMDGGIGAVWIAR